MEKLPETTIPPITRVRLRRRRPRRHRHTASATGTAAATATPTRRTNGHSDAAPTAQKFPVTVTNGANWATNNQTYQVNTQTALSTSTRTLNSIVVGLDQQFGPAYSPRRSIRLMPSIASATTPNAFLAVAVAALVILVYIAFAFRKVGSVRQSFRYGASAIIALLHDALVVLGLWAIFGHFFGFKVDSLFLTAILTVIGFSVHDTIVVFDRIRENMSRRTSESFETMVNASLVQTMTRSLNTSLTVLFTLAALTLFGGESIQRVHAGAADRHRVRERSPRSSTPA